MLTFRYNNSVFKMGEEECVENTTGYEGNTDSKDEEKHRKIDYLKRFSLEPCVFLFGFGFYLIEVQISTLYIQKTCKVGSYFFGNQTFDIEVSFEIYICENQLLSTSYAIIFSMDLLLMNKR